MTRQNLPPGAVSPRRRAMPTNRFLKIYTMKSIYYVRERAWHGARIVNAGSPPWEWLRTKPRPQRGAEDAKRYLGKRIQDSLRGAAGDGPVGDVSQCYVPDQGSRQHR